MLDNIELKIDRSDLMKMSKGALKSMGLVLAVVMPS